MKPPVTPEMRAHARARYMFPEGCCCGALKDSYSCHYCDFYYEAVKEFEIGSQLQKSDIKRDASVAEIV